MRLDTFVWDVDGEGAGPGHGENGHGREKSDCLHASFEYRTIQGRQIIFVAHIHRLRSIHPQQFEHNQITPLACCNVEKAAMPVLEAEVAVDSDSGGDKFIERVFQIVFDCEQQGKLAERLDACAELVESVVESMMEDAVRARESVDGREVGDQCWFFESRIIAKTPHWVKNCLLSREGNGVEYQLRRKISKFCHGVLDVQRRAWLGQNASIKLPQMDLDDNASRTPCRARGQVTAELAQARDCEVVNSEVISH